MKALKYIGVLLLTLIAIVLLLGLVAPKKSHLERSALIQASPESLQDIVRKFSETKNWSPWMEIDPNMKITYDGQDGAIGSNYSWDGNAQAGKGKQILTKIEPGFVENKIIFEKPIAGEAIVGMQLVPESGGTKATWSFDSESPYPFNVMNLFFSVEKNLGPQFEKGLSKLKAYAESKKATLYRGFEVKESTGIEKNYLAIRKTIGFNEVPQFLGTSYATITEAVKKAGVEMDGMPTGLYYIYDEKTGTTDMAAAIPVKGKPAETKLSLITIPAGKEIFVDYYGSYEKSGDGHYALDEYMKAKNLTFIAPAIEQYITDPMMEKDTAKWLTRIVYNVQSK